MSGSTTPFFTPGDLVVSVYGNGDGSGPYTDNQAAPIVLQELTTSGSFVTQMVLPQTTTVVNGVTENAISGEYGSSSEGSLNLSGDGHSLVIGGYGVNAATYNAGGAAVYGNAALAQTTSLQGGVYTPVARVVADISADGAVDTSTALYGVFNTNNIRSVATQDGKSFYVSGQGVKGDKTQGVFTATDGAGKATAIDTSTDTRSLELYDGALYVSRDSKQGPTANISSYGPTPTGATTPATLNGISNSVTLTAAEENGVNNASVGSKVFLSPENFFFANSTTLYVADSGNPKQAGLGDGGLQKWSLVGSGWTLDYTLSSGLNLVADTATAGTTGLIGLTGKVSGDTVTLYATNATLGDLDQTYLYGITDTLSAGSGADESFTTLATAAAGTNIRGVSFAPTDANCFVAGTLILTDAGERPIETLRAGDTAITRVDGRDVPARIVWVGQRRVDVAAHPTPEHVRPVRIAAGALSDGVPSRTLRVSPDHALLLDGVLVPARLLLNGASIALESPALVQYWHVELEQHAVLVADGALAESYLDTGNRYQFDQAGAPTALHPSFARADHPRACARLATDADTVQPLWRRCADRAQVGACLPITQEAGLHLLLPDGRCMPPGRIEADGRHVFWLDGALPTATLRLRSRHAAPAATRPWLDDRRSLGVAVAGVALWTRRDGLDPLVQPTGALAAEAGWWPAEPGSVSRWTDGDAALDVPAGCLRIDVMVTAIAAYPLESVAA